MRNYYDPCCAGEPIIGQIIYGSKFPFGTVSEETYTSAMASVNASISALTSAVSASQADIDDLEEIVIEGQLDEAVAANTANITTLSGTVTSLNSTVSTLNSGVSALDVAVVAVKADVNAVKSDITGLKAKDTELDTKITAVQNTNITQESDITALKTRMTAAEAAITEARNNITTLSGRMTNYETSYTVLNNKVVNLSDGLNDRIDGLATNMTVMRNNIQTLSTAINDLSVSMAAQIATINQRLATIEGGVAIGILSFTATPAVLEKGETKNIVLNWTTKGDVKVIKVNNEVVSGNTKTITNVQTTQEFTLYVADAKGISDTKKITVSANNHSYWGLDASGLMTEGTVKGLDYSDLLEKRARTFTLNPNNSYIYYSYPKRLGTSTFWANGFAGGFTDPTTVLVSNDSGYSEDYYVYRSENKLTGSIEIEVK